MLQNDQTQRQVAGAVGVSQSVISWLWTRLQVTSAWCRTEVRSGRSLKVKTATDWPEESASSLIQRYKNHKF